MIHNNVATNFSFINKFNLPITLSRKLLFLCKCKKFVS
uniref:Uncharacterized protein n=1 Tax=Rheinheimera sp. BAL341 TaxID=1708203 RepID=A0A486XK76_9GAMM